jgi:hypothetical protein
MRLHTLLCSSAGLDLVAGREAEGDKVEEGRDRKLQATEAVSPVIR